MNQRRTYPAVYHYRVLRSGGLFRVADTTLVTGPTGFVGRAVLSDARDDRRRIRLLSRRPLDTAFESLIMNSDRATDERVWDSAMKGVQSVLHLAARAHVLGASDDRSFIKTNVELTCRVADAAFSRGVRRFVFVSSIGAVAASSQPHLPLHEHVPCTPQTPYGISKLRAERELRKLAVLHGAELVIVRPPLVHGPGAPGNLALLAAAIKMGIPLPLAGVDNLRSMIHVRNLSKFLWLCLDNARAAGHTFHVRDQSDYSTPQILRGIAATMGRPIRLFRLPVSALQMGARVTRQQGVLEQLVSFLQVDDSHARRELHFAADPYPIEAVRSMAPARTTL